MFYCSIQGYSKPILIGYFSLMAIFGWSSLVGDAAAQTKDREYQNSINNIGQKIKRISQNLNNDKVKLKSERHKLFKAEQNLANITEKLAKTEFELAKNEHELAAVELQIKRVMTSYERNRQSVMTLISQRYQKGKPNYLKNVLNQENPYAVGRLANYNNYFSRALKKKNQELNKQASNVFHLKGKQEAIVEKLKADKINQKSQLSNQKTAKKERENSVERLDKKVTSNTQVLLKLTNDRKRLSVLLVQLEKQAAELKRLDVERKKRAAELARQKRQPPKVTKAMPRLLVKGGFKKQKGRLKYPVKAKLTRQYGGRLPESGMRSEGHFFDTKGSVNVQSIFRGRVLFADFLKGYGLLIIVDHGDDHISLYGHNERLLKSVGDPVRVNEVIAKSGMTGGLKSHGLYFEIRYNATPVDPAKWCQKR